MPVSFSIGNKGYIGTGWNSAWTCHDDFWEWDQATDTWTQKANFPGTKRRAAVGFSIGTKGYVGTGDDWGSVQRKDFWEWDQLTNTWTQRSNVPGLGRSFAAGFSIGNYGYIGLGYDSLNNCPDDFWQYDPSTDLWSQKANFAGGGRAAMACFSVGNKGYIGTGSNAVTTLNNLQDFWEWDQATDTWTQKANFPGIGRSEAIGLSVGNYGYIGVGQHFLSTSYNCLSDFWQYNPNTNTWTQMANFGGGVREFPAAFSIGCKGYMGTGWINDMLSTYDFWEFTPPAPSAAMAGINTICSGTGTTLYAWGGLSYQWSTGATTNSIIAQPTATTNYSVIVSDVCGSDTASMTVTVIPSPVSNFTFKNDLCARCTEFSDASLIATTWSWSFGDNTFSSSQDPSHCFPDTGTYSVSLITQSTHPMCRDTFNTTVAFYNTDETQIVVPNVFTPNGDGVNDVFKIPGLDKCEPYSIKIYDRWGNLIFATEKTGLGWDGRTSTGVNSQAGVYYYTLTNSLTTRNGFVTLLR